MAVVKACFLVVVAIAWLVMVWLMVARLVVGEPAGLAEQLMAAFAIGYVGIVFMTDALNAITAALLARHRHLDRRTQI